MVTTVSILNVSSVRRLDNVGQRGAIRFPGAFVFENAGRLFGDAMAEETLDQVQGHIDSERNAATRQDRSGVDDSRLDCAGVWIPLGEQVERTRFAIDDLALGCRGASRKQARGADDHASGAYASDGAIAPVKRVDERQNRRVVRCGLPAGSAKDDQNIGGRAIGKTVVGHEPQSIRHRQLAARFGYDKKSQAGRQPLRHRQHAVGRADIDGFNSVVGEDGEGCFRRLHLVEPALGHHLRLPFVFRVGEALDVVEQHRRVRRQARALDVSRAIPERRSDQRLAAVEECLFDCDN